jgi:capsular polysaccharide biosynthesis protein
MIRAELSVLFGSVPAEARNLEIVGAFPAYRRDIPRAMIWGESGLVVDVDGRPVIDALWFPEQLGNCPNFHLSWRRFFPKPVAGVYFNVMLYWCRGYYHWICDVLPRVQSALPHLPAGTRFIVPDCMTEPERQSLHAAGVSPESWVSYRGKRPWCVEKLVHVPPVAMTGDHTGESLAKLRQSVFRHFGVSGLPMGSRRIYISRKRGAERSIVNEAELLPVLHRNGFEIVCCEELSFEQQVRLFREAGMVVGPHGGGFTNLLWCHPGTRVFEVLGSNSIRRCYWSLCSVLGFDHHCGIVEQPKVEGSMQVDPLLFENGLRAVLRTKSAP